MRKVFLFSFFYLWSEKYFWKNFKEPAIPAATFGMLTYKNNYDTQSLKVW